LINKWKINVKHKSDEYDIGSFTNILDAAVGADIINTYFQRYRKLNFPLRQEEYLNIINKFQINETNFHRLKTLPILSN
jgi:hypothetical protein